MSTLLTCPRGHHWPQPTRLLPSADPDPCPICGNLSVPERGAPTPPAALSPPEDPRWSGVRLGPALPMACFTSTEIWHPERIGALALYCSDGRWGDAFDEFCHRRLFLPRYDRWAVPGGPAWLGTHTDSEDFAQAAREQLDFLVRVHQLERVVLITHYACAYYGEHLGRDADGCLPVQIDDVGAAVETLREWFPGLSAEAYLAMRRDNCLTFHRLEG